MLALAQIVIALTVSAVVLALSQFFGGDHPTARLLLSGCLAVYTWIIVECVSRPGERIFALSAALFFSVIVIVPGIFHCAAGVFPFFAKTYPDDLVTQAGWIMLAFTLPVGAAYAAAPKSTPADSVQQAGEPSVSTAFVMMVLLVGVALLIFASRPTTFTLRRLDLGIIGVASPVDLIVVSTGRFSAFLAFLINLHLLFKVRKLGFLWMLPVTAVVAYLLNNPYNIARFPLLALAICTTFCMLNTSTQKFKLFYATSYIVGILTIFPFLSTYGRGVRGAQLKTGFKDYYIRSGDFDGVQSLVNIVYWIQKEGINWGHQLLGSLLVFVPRSMWEGKSEGTGGVAARYVGYPFTNISAPLPGEIYSDFSFVGVVVGGAVFGWALSALDRKAASARSSLARTFALGMGAGFMSILLRGSLIGVIAASALAILMGWVVGRMLDRRIAVAALPQRGSVAKSPAG